jgi:hypothetical protein
MTSTIRTPRHRLRAFLLVLAVASFASSLRAQDPKAIVSAAVTSELNANRIDHSAFMYRDHDVTPDHDTLYFMVETPQGNLRKKLEDHGHPLSPDQRRADAAAIQALVSDSSLMQKQRQNDQHDGEQAEQMLKLLPVAYIWTIASEKGDLVTLNFRPDPNFDPSNMEARVLSAMAGQIVVDRDGNRIATIRGSLVDDVKFGFGILGRLRKGGSFDVERREVAPHHWQITESHIHISGRALFFKSIGDQEDEVKTDFHPSPAQTLQQAQQILRETH